jgi:3'-phosphoadenosine 5'-phosphosulfate sulfotransferase (PAPS reductase)/FAD synthetase
MPRTAYTPSLPGLSTTDDLDTVINWGLGADSTAYLARTLTEPAAHGIDLERTAVLYMATGSEWPETRLLVEEFMLPLLREHGVRFVQLARNGRHSQKSAAPNCQGPEPNSCRNDQ